MQTYLRSGKYNPSNGMFIYYENSNNCFWASENKDKIEVCYGPSSGGCDYWDIPLYLKKNLLEIVNSTGRNSTRSLLKLVRENDINKKEEKEENGLSVKYNLVGKDGNAFALLSGFRNAALKQGKDRVVVESILEEAKKGDYSHLIGVLLNNTI